MKKVDRICRECADIFLRRSCKKGVFVYGYDPAKRETLPEDPRPLEKVYIYIYIYSYLYLHLFIYI